METKGGLGMGGYWLGGDGKKRDKIRYGNPARACVCGCPDNALNGSEWFSHTYTLQNQVS